MTSAALRQPLDLRIDRRRAYAAGDEKITPTAQRLGRQGYELRRVPQRTGEIGQRVAGFQRADLARRDADRLRHDRDRTGRAVVIGHRQRHPLALLVGTDDDELSGQRRSRHTRRFDPHPENPRREFRLFYDSKHILFLDKCSLFDHRRRTHRQHRAFGIVGDDADPLHRDAVFTVGRRKADPHPAAAYSRIRGSPRPVPSAGVRPYCATKSTSSTARKNA